MITSNETALSTLFHKAAQAAPPGAKRKGQPSGPLQPYRPVNEAALAKRRILGDVAYDADLKLQRRLAEPWPLRRWESRILPNPEPTVSAPAGGLKPLPKPEPVGPSPAGAAQPLALPAPKQAADVSDFRLAFPEAAGREADFVEGFLKRAHEICGHSIEGTPDLPQALLSIAIAEKLASTPGFLAGFTKQLAAVGAPSA